MSKKGVIIMNKVNDKTIVMVSPVSFLFRKCEW